MARQTQPVSFPGASGATLAARLDAPAERPLAYALFAHCFTCSKDTKAATYISAALAGRGIAVLRLLKDSLGAIKAEGEALVDIAGRAFRIRKQFLDDIQGRKLGGIVARLGKALLVMHSPRDTIVDIENATMIFTAARHPKSFV